MSRDDVLKWYFGCIAVIVIAVSSCVAVEKISGAERLRREAVLLGYATDGPDGFKWKDRK